MKAFQILARAGLWLVVYMRTKEHISKQLCNPAELENKTTPITLNRPLLSKSLATIIFKELKGINKKALFRIVPAQTAFKLVYTLNFLEECELFFISGFFLENFEVMT